VLKTQFHQKIIQHANLNKTFRALYRSNFLSILIVDHKIFPDSLKLGDLKGWISVY